ncbi:DegT/DnrJ/EryC1/StrS family aminotransferase [Peptococcaceae bacterium 1198_IL3148]
MIPIVEPQLGIEEQQEIIKVLNSKMLASGKWVEQFQDSFADYLNIRYAVATSSGTTALHAALDALQISKGDKVLTTPFSFVASANAILYCGATPIFVDIDPLTYNISPAALAETIKEHPDAKAILVVHIFGQPAEMETICRLAKANNLLLIEDCAQAHGAVYQGQRVGTFGDVAAFSFYPTKNMTCGEGGMVTTNNEEVARRVRMLINHGQSKRYYHDMLGYNFRMTNLHAAIGLVQLKKLDGFNKKRIDNAHYYYQNINNDQVILPYQAKEAQHVYHQFTVQCDERDNFMNYLINKGIGCAIHYPIAIPRQKLYVQKFNYQQTWPVAERLCNNCLSIPVHPGLTTEQLHYIVEAVNDYE